MAARCPTCSSEGETGDSVQESAECVFKAVRRCDGVVAGQTGAARPQRSSS